VKSLVHRFRRLIAELRRRKVFRVVSAYCVAAWVVAQVAALAFPAFDLPAWTVTFVLVLVILGLPITVGLAWAYDVIPDGGQTALAPPAPAWQLVPSLPPAAASDASPAPEPSLAPGVSRGLPSASTPFVGREEERREIRARLLGGECRLVSIVGAGGLGKTRLALEVARDLEPEFADGAVFIGLDSLTNAAAVAPTVAERLGIRLGGSADPRTEIIEFLGDKRCLLVFDNFEQVSEAAGLVSAILAGAPATRAIVTSRERLKLHGEAVVPLDGLRQRADAGGAGEPSEAARLFVQSARLATPHFAPTAEDEKHIAHIVHLVEGMPLAIELAAAWIRMLPCREIAAEIRANHDFLSLSPRDAPDRHRSLRTVFEGSWRMLSDTERRTLRRLGVFHGGFTREAATAVAGADSGALLALVDRSLVRRVDGERFDVLPVLRQYAEEHLREDPQEERWTRALHCEYFTRLLQRYEEEQHRPDGETPLDRLAVDLENIRQATGWAIREHDFEKVSGAVDIMFAFFDGRGRAREGEEQFGHAVEMIEAARDIAPGRTASREIVLRRLQARQGVFCFRLGRHTDALRLLEQAAEGARRNDDRRELAFCLEKLGSVACEMGEYDAAQALCEESIAVSRALGDDEAVAGALVDLGNALLARGDAAAAKRSYEESLVLRQKGDRSRVWILLCNLGSIAAMQGALAEAERLFQASLAAAGEVRNSRGVATTLLNLGCVAADAGDRLKAREHFEECLATCQRMGYRSLASSCLLELGTTEFHLGDAAGAAGRLRQALDFALVSGQAPLMLAVFVAASRILADDGQHGLAAKLLRTAARHPAGEQSTQDEARALLEKGFGWPAPPDGSGPSPVDAEPGDLDTLARQLSDRLALLQSAVRA
jgi:predicted ATPase